jgi:hypothetical protein
MDKVPLSKEAKRKITWFWIRLGVLMFVVIVLLGVALGPITCGIKSAQQSVAVQTAHLLTTALYSYANDHNGKYPDGKTSTEVFQQLLDQGYVTDPTIFYFDFLHLPGKVRPENNRLKPENVTWDVTAGVDASSPGDLPVVFLTGYRVDYQAGGSANLMQAPPKRTWGDWSNDTPKWEPFMAYGCTSGSAHKTLANADGTIPNFIPADFDPKGKTYRQLTP